MEQLDGVHLAIAWMILVTEPADSLSIQSVELVDCNACLRLVKDTQNLNVGNVLELTLLSFDLLVHL